MQSIDGLSRRACRIARTSTSIAIEQTRGFREKHLPEFSQAQHALGFAKSPKLFLANPEFLALLNYYHFRPRSDKFMNRIFNFVFPPALVLVAMFVSLPAVASAQDFAPPAAGWPDDNASFANVDHAVQKANYEFESMTGNMSQALQDSPASELLNKMQPMADDLTQSFKQNAG